MIVIVEFFVEACRRATDRLAKAGVTLDLRQTDESPKPGIRLDATSSRALAQLVLWETGELELVIADLRTGDVVVNEHREVSSQVGIADVMQTIEAHLVDASEP